MQNMPVPKIIIQSCAFYRHRCEHISWKFITSIQNSLYFTHNSPQIFLWRHFQHTYLQPITIHLLRVNVADYKIENRYKVKKKLNKYTCTGIDSILEKNNTWALFITQTRNLSNSFDKANQDSRVYCPRLLFLVPVYYVKKQIFGNALTRSCAQN